MTADQALAYLLDHTPWMVPQFDEIAANRGVIRVLGMYAEHFAMSVHHFKDLVEGLY
jgi:hypothetical protein